MRSNVPILTFISRSWLLLLFTLGVNLAYRSNVEIYDGKSLAELAGGPLAFLALASLDLLSGLFCVHLFFRQTIDQDAHDGTYVREWRSLSPFQRCTLATVVRIGIALAFALIAAGVAHAESPAPNYAQMWRTAKIKPSCQMALDQLVDRYQRSVQRYAAIARAGVPAPVLFALHYRESDNNFRAHPHEGSSLLHRTLYVPKGRLPAPAAPPFTFEQSAADAYYVCDRLQNTNWRDVQSAFNRTESFNGLGYRRRGIVSPYNASGTQFYARGYFTGDGRFSPTAINQQMGVMAILLRMKQRGIALPF